MHTHEAKHTHSHGARHVACVHDAPRSPVLLSTPKKYGECVMLMDVKQRNRITSLRISSLLPPSETKHGRRVIRFDCTWAQSSFCVLYVISCVSLCAKSCCCCFWIYYEWCYRCAARESDWIFFVFFALRHSNHTQTQKEKHTSPHRVTCTVH